MCIIWNEPKGVLISSCQIEFSCNLFPRLSLDAVQRLIPLLCQALQTSVAIQNYKFCGVTQQPIIFLIYHKF